MKITIWTFVLIFFSGFILKGCTDDRTNEKISAESFPNVLNLKGIPKGHEDRSVYIYSDKGAWHGYSLPPDDDQANAGSFIGPYLMTQDNGIWLSESFSQIKIERGGKTIFPGKHETINNVSFPHQLLREYEIKNPHLSIKTDLILVSGRTSLIRVSIQNLSQTDQRITINFSGETFPGIAQLEKAENGILIDFDDHTNIGFLKSGGLMHETHTSGETGYRTEFANVEIPKSSSIDFYQTQTFCFNQSELDKETVLIDQVLQNPDQYFSENLRIWNSKIQKVVDQLNPIYTADADQRVAVKCLQTLNNNWRSAAGLLKHDGLFPSYNYKWFNGFWAWDSWKHAAAIALYDPELAKDQIRAMYDYQDEFGMIADCIYRDTVLEQINRRNTKPPLSAWVVWKVYKASDNTNFLNEMFQKIEKYHNWWYAFRDADNNGICEYGSTDGALVAAKWESGMDNAVRFDDAEIHQDKNTGFSLNQESIDLNSFLCFEKQYLANMAEVLGKHHKAADYLNTYENLKIRITGTSYDTDDAPKYFLV